MILGALRKFILQFGLIFFIPGLLMAHPWKPSKYLVIDIDGGIDDFRTINLLLASPSVRILGISCSNGVLTAEQTHQKLLGLLKSTYHEGILTSINTSEKSIAKRCTTAVNFEWGDVTQQPDTILSQIQMLNHILKNTNEKLTFLNLGSLRTTASYVPYIQNFNKRINKIIWLTNYPEITESFNYLTDTFAYNEVINQKLPLQIINGTKNLPDYTPEYAEELKNTGLIHALITAKSFSDIQSPYVMKIYDETGAIYVHFPELFQTDTINEHLFCSSLLKNISQQKINQCLLDIIQGETINQNQLFSSFPTNTNAYAEDIQPIIEQTFYNFGKDEWIASVMTMELHRHVGTYALMGSKMGIRAREYFGAGIDEMNIITFAGSTPPFSCLNDGLQVSTGATLGHGLIRHSDTDEMIPAAVFEYLGQKIRLELKESYKNQIKQEIKEARMLYGLESDEYWELVRLRTIYYWSHWDRHNIFNITKLR